jgi:hypothetical protein
MWPCSVPVPAGAACEPDGELVAGALCAPEFGAVCVPAAGADGVAGGGVFCGGAGAAWVPASGAGAAGGVVVCGAGAPVESAAGGGVAAGAGWPCVAGGAAGVDCARATEQADASAKAMMKATKKPDINEWDFEDELDFEGKISSLAHVCLPMKKGLDYSVPAPESPELRLQLESKSCACGASSSGSTPASNLTALTPPFAPGPSSVATIITASPFCKLAS